MSLNLQSTPSSSSFRQVDVREFAWLGPDRQLAEVFHYRSRYSESGQWSQEVVSWTSQEINGVEVLKTYFES